MTLKQIKYKNNRLKGMNQYNAARAAGYSETYAKVAGSRRLEKSIKVNLADAFERAGFTDKFAIEYALDALEATKLYGKDAKEHPDWQARHKFYETIMKLTERLRDSDKPGVVVINYVYGNNSQPPIGAVRVAGRTTERSESDTATGDRLGSPGSREPDTA